MDLVHTLLLFKHWCAVLFGADYGMFHHVLLNGGSSGNRAGKKLATKSREIYLDSFPVATAGNPTTYSREGFTQRLLELKLVGH